LRGYCEQERHSNSFHKLSFEATSILFAPDGFRRGRGGYYAGVVTKRASSNAEMSLKKAVSGSD
jgi:hypothetical protein